MYSVKPIDDIRYYLSQCPTIDGASTYVVDYHRSQPQNTFASLPTFVAHAYRCRAHPLPFVVDENMRMHYQFFWPLLSKVKHKPHKSHNLWTRWPSAGENLQLNMAEPTAYFEEKHKYVWMPVDAESVNNPWHVWIDVISKIRLLLTQDTDPSSKVFVFPNSGPYLQKVIDEVFPLINAKYMKPTDVWQFEHLIMPSMSNSQDGVVVPALPQYLRNTSLAKRTEETKIYISRDNAKTRRLTNQHELILALSGYQRVELGAQSIQEQQQILANATHVVAIHGAGLVNLLWCAPGTRVVEINHSEQINKKVYPVLSYHLGLNHTVVYGKKIPLGNLDKKPAGVKRINDYADIEVNIDQVMQALNQ